jgi:hypothetical protein
MAPVRVVGLAPLVLGLPRALGGLLPVLVESLRRAPRPLHDSSRSAGALPVTTDAAIERAPFHTSRQLLLGLFRPKPGGATCSTDS